MTLKINPYKLVESRFPSQVDLNGWSPAKWVFFLRFMEFYIEKGPEQEKFSLTTEKIKQMEDFLKEDNHPFNEFIYRVGKWVKGGLGGENGASYKQYSDKFLSMTRWCLTYLKRHPGSITKEMADIIQTHPERMGWCLTQYKVEEGVSGIETVQQDTTLDKNQRHADETKLPTIQARMMTAAVKILDIYEDVASSISKKELKEMDAKDKITALSKLSFIFQLATKKMTQNTFTTINLNGSSKAMEESMLAFIKKKDKTE